MTDLRPGVRHELLAALPIDGSWVAWEDVLRARKDQLVQFWLMDQVQDLDVLMAEQTAWWRRARLEAEQLGEIDERRVRGVDKIQLTAKGKATLMHLQGVA